GAVGLRLLRPESRRGRIAVRPAARPSAQPPHRGDLGRLRGDIARSPAGLLPGETPVVSTPLDDRAARLVAALGGDAVLARAPGRVTLIGEHPDYTGLPVLPFAIAHDVMIAGKIRSDRTIAAVNRDERFEPRRFPAISPLAPFPPGDWG